MCCDPAGRLRWLLLLVGHFATVCLSQVDPAITTWPDAPRYNHNTNVEDPAGNVGVLLIARGTSTSTLEPITTDISASGPSTTGALSIDTALQPAKTPIPLAATIGLIMPDPKSQIYVGDNYSFGFVDAVQRPAPTIGGWLRQVQPLLVLPDYEVNVFPSTGESDPGASGATPLGSGSLCGSTAENWAISYPFRFERSGWYNFVINQTWLQPTIQNNDTCALPIVAEKSFFSWQFLSVAPLPNISPTPPSPTSQNTVFKEVVTSTPSQLPFEKGHASSGQKLAVGLGVTGAIVALVIMCLVIYYAQRRQKMRREALAFSRMSESDKAAFLAENPDSWLNPNRPSRRNRYDEGHSPGGNGYQDWYWRQMWNRQHASWRYGGNWRNGWRSGRARTPDWGDGYGGPMSKGGPTTAPYGQMGYQGGSARPMAQLYNYQHTY